MVGALFNLSCQRRRSNDELKIGNQVYRVSFNTDILNKGDEVYLVSFNTDILNEGDEVYLASSFYTDILNEDEKEILQRIQQTEDLENNNTIVKRIIDDPEKFPNLTVSVVNYVDNESSKIKRRHFRKEGKSITQVGKFNDEHKLTSGKQISNYNIISNGHSYPITQSAHLTDNKIIQETIANKGAGKKIIITGSGAEEEIKDGSISFQDQSGCKSKHQTLNISGGELSS